MRKSAIIAVTLLAISPLPFQSSVQAQSAIRPSADGEAFEFRWDTFSSKPYEYQIQRLRDEASVHCRTMADRSISGYQSRRGFVAACNRIIERKAKTQLAVRSPAIEKGAQLARRPSPE